MDTYRWPFDAGCLVELLILRGKPIGEMGLLPRSRGLKGKRLGFSAAGAAAASAAGYQVQQTSMFGRTTIKDRRVTQAVFRLEKPPLGPPTLCPPAPWRHATSAKRGKGSDGKLSFMRCVFFFSMVRAISLLFMEKLLDDRRFT